MSDVCLGVHLDLAGGHHTHHMRVPLSLYPDKGDRGVDGGGTVQAHSGLRGSKRLWEFGYLLLAFFVSRDLCHRCQRCHWHVKNKIRR